MTITIYREMLQCSDAMTQGYLRSRLSYDPATGIFVWLKPPKNHMRLSGKIAGCPIGGYVKISIDCTRYAAHRLAWLYVYGAWPSRCLDHRDGNPLNNSISNLREATHTQNQANSTPRVGKALPKGVRKNRSKYTARIRANGRLITIGTFQTISEAASAYAKESLRVHGEFARSE